MSFFLLEKKILSNNKKTEINSELSKITTSK